MSQDIADILRNLLKDVEEIKSSTSNLDESLKSLQELTEENHRELLETLRDTLDTGSGFSIESYPDDTLEE